MSQIKYANEINVLNKKWEDLLVTILDSINIPSIQINSTYRTAKAQATAMYENIQRYGLQSQYDIYYGNYEKVLREYEIKKHYNYGVVDQIKAMEDTIVKLGITGGHLTNPTDTDIVFDVQPSSIPDDKIEDFKNAIKKIGTTFGPQKGEPAIHIVLSGKPEYLKKLFIKETSTPKVKPSKKEVKELSDAQVLTKNNRIYEELGDGVLQIGDLLFIVDPTQLAFNTQNGYQYFPTLRTQGNPKIPTMNQVKNISINLIFPNEDSINYQLLNLYAMFKRTPFVTIRNKDISAFFIDICFDDEWVSVALESIQIQSVNGFPNTLQASITILPFDYKMV